MHFDKCSELKVWTAMSEQFCKSSEGCCKGTPCIEISNGGINRQRPSDADKEFTRSAAMTQNALLADPVRVSKLLTTFISTSSTGNSHGHVGRAAKQNTRRVRFGILASMYLSLIHI